MHVSNACEPTPQDMSNHCSPPRADERDGVEIRRVTSTSMKRLHGPAAQVYTMYARINRGQPCIDCCCLLLPWLLATRLPASAQC